MNLQRSRLYLGILAVLIVANIAWRIHANWGLITVHADGTSINTVLRSIEKQAGIQLRTDLAEDKTVTMHVTKVPLLHALEVLSANTNAGWSVAYFAAPDQGSIDAALAEIGHGQEPEGWKRFSGFGGGRRGMGDPERGVSDPREEVWKPKAASENTLHAYFEQAAFLTSAQFWAPTAWDARIGKTPKEDELSDAVPSLAKAAGGKSAEIFLLRGRPQMQERGAGEANGAVTSARGEGRGRGGEPPTEAQRQAMEERALARIEQLPEDKRAAARAEFEERRKFFQELAQLTPEQRRAKMQERMEEAMNNGEIAARMEAGSAKRGAMQSAEQRTERYREYLNNKTQKTN